MATLGMEAMRATMLSIGTYFYPLRRLDDAADLLWAIFKYPAGLPNRVSKVKNAMSNADATDGLVQLMDRLGTMPAVKQLVDKLPPVDGMELVTDRERCVVCSEPLTSDVYHEGTAGRASRRAQSTPAVYGENGSVRNVTLCPKQCTACKAKHYVSYAEGGTLIPKGCQRYYDDSTSARWFHVTKDTVWSTQLLLQFEVQAVCSHTGFDTFMSEYALLHGGARASNVNSSTRKRLAHAFFGWTALRWTKELGWTLRPLPLGSIEGLDRTLLELTPRLAASFTEKWGKHHARFCRTPGRCVSMSADGHMKARRTVCRNKWARIKKVPGLGQLVLNCPRRPMKGSYFCAECREVAASRGAEGLVLAGGISGGIVSGTSTVPLAPTIDEAAAEWRAARGWSAEAAIEANEKNVFLVEDILEHKQGTISELGESHRACVRAAWPKKPRTMYKVRWLGYDPSFDSWVCACSVGKKAIDEYETQRKKARPRKVGRLAAAWNAALDQCEASTGDFAKSATDEATFAQVACECLKEFQYAEKKQTTAGVLALVSSCGLFIKVSEIFGSDVAGVPLFVRDLCGGRGSDAKGDRV